ncbi:MAG: hypothetical protein KC431_30895, partial [Myxococcales bacterium]|nr:hypothetical protein [Myxococcales bacterium]
VPNPGACCVAEAGPEDIEGACMDDCGYAACQLAIDKLRTAAEALPNPNSPPVQQQAEMVVRADLFAYANLLEAPEVFTACQEAVSKANGELAKVNLGEGMSSPSALGHVKSATLSLQCNLDSVTPYSDDATTCETTPNQPKLDQGVVRDGFAGGGQVTLFTADGLEQASIGEVAFSVREGSSGDGTTMLSLLEFEAEIADADHDGLHFEAPQLWLTSPAAALVEGDSLRFPAAALRFEASAVLSVDGVYLFEGERVTLEVSNSAPALALRSGEGFAFVELPFEVGGYPIVVNTQAP